MKIERVINGFIVTYPNGNREIFTEEQLTDTLMKKSTESIYKMEMNMPYEIDVMLKNFNGDIV